LAFIGLAALGIIWLLNPASFDRLKRLETSAFNLELFEEVKKEINDINKMLPLLLPSDERRHLLNLSEGEVSNYKGGHLLRAELRRLRSIGLIEMQGERKIAEIKDREIVDLSKYLTLTDLGKYWVEQIKEIESTDATEESNH
jgi:hypothetical protein